MKKLSTLALALFAVLSINQPAEANCRATCDSQLDQCFSTAVTSTDWNSCYNTYNACIDACESCFHFVTETGEEVLNNNVTETKVCINMFNQPQLCTVNTDTTTKTPWTKTYKQFCDGFRNLLSITAGPPMTTSIQTIAFCPFVVTC